MCNFACCTHLGIFPYLDAQRYDPDESAAIEIGELTVGQDYCLEFYYHMHGSDIGSLLVSTNVLTEPQFSVENGRLHDIMVAFIPLIKSML